MVDPAVVERRLMQFRKEETQRLGEIDMSNETWRDTLEGLAPVIEQMPQGLKGSYPTLWSFVN